MNDVSLSLSPHPFRRCMAIAWPVAALIILLSGNSGVWAQSEDYGSGSYESGSRYGSEPGSGAYGSSRRGGEVQLDLFQMVVPDIPTLLSETGMGQGPDSHHPVDLYTGPLLRRDAELALQAGNMPLALEYYFAHAAVEYDEAQSALQAVKYSHVLRRPVWQIRWGVSLALHGDTNVRDYQPITAESSQGGADRRGSYSGSGSYGESGSGSYSDSDSELASSGREGSFERGRSALEGAAGGIGGAAAPGAPPSMLSEDARKQLNEALGLVAETMGNEFSERFREGDFGNALASLVVSETAESEPPEESARSSDYDAGSSRGPAKSYSTDSDYGSSDSRGSGGRRSSAGSFGDPDEEEQPAVADNPMPTNTQTPMWQPGVVFLGEGPTSEMLDTAREHQIDLLLHFDVAIKETRGEAVKNVSRCRLLHVPTGKGLGISKGMDSFDVMQQAQAKRTNPQAYVDEQLANLLAIIDKQATVSEMPKLTAEIARRRVGTLLDSKSLRTLAEIRLYQSQGLLQPEEVEQAFAIIGGDEGLVMLYGDAERKREVARKWAQRD